MILKKATIKYSGVNPDTLSHGSRKRVCVSCNQCGKINWVEFRQVHNLCHTCSLSGKNNPMYGVHRYGEDAPHYGHKHTIESKKAMKYNRKNTNGMNNPNYGKTQSLKSRMKNSCNQQNINIKDFDGFKNRKHVLPEWKCIKLNERFNNCNMHHITKSIVIYIPKELHEHIPHSLKSGSGMKSMNMLSLQFINGGL